MSSIQISRFFSIIKKLLFILKQLFYWLLRVLYPSYCTHCFSALEHENVLCDPCIRLIQPVIAQKLSVTKKQSITIHAIGLYKDPLRILILSKNRPDSISSRQLAHLIWHHTFFKYKQYDYLIPIPLHWTRYAWRGFNQAEEMAKELSRLSAIPVVSLLKRSRRTKFQSQFIGIEREGNVQGVFALNTTDIPLYKDKHLVLVDDMLTTGSTIRSAAKELIKVTPASITAVVGCKTS